MTKWPVDGSVHDRPEGVLQNVRDNLGWPEVACLRHVRILFFTNRFQSNVPQNSVE